MGWGEKTVIENEATLTSSGVDRLSTQSWFGERESIRLSAMTEALQAARVPVRPPTVHPNLFP